MSHKKDDFDFDEDGEFDPTTHIEDSDDSDKNKDGHHQVHEDHCPTGRSQEWALPEQPTALVMVAIDQVRVETFDEVVLPVDLIAATKEAWTSYLSNSKEAAGEAIYSAIFEAAPSLQNLFKKPRAIVSMHFISALTAAVQVLHKPPALKAAVEMLGFQHLDLEVTEPRVAIFRDAILELLEAEMGERLTTSARTGFASLLNYMGGAFIFIRREYSGRLKLINSSWRVANKKPSDDLEDGELADEHEPTTCDEVPNQSPTQSDEGPNPTRRKSAHSASKKRRRKEDKQVEVPDDFNAMFAFNAAVMGCNEGSWMREVLNSFDDIVTHASNSSRLQEECDVLSLRLAKFKKGDIKLEEFKAIMLASLRSLLPRDWDTEHEVAWGWLWANIEKMIQAMLGKPRIMQKALAKFLKSLTDDQWNFVRREVYVRFFAVAPTGQDYFKQSTTRLYWIADKVVEMTLEMYRAPKRMVSDISALGLRHVGYGIPNEFFAPFVSAAVAVIRSITSDDVAEEGFRWSLSLISRILMRTVSEGSTIVMKAINSNSGRQLRKAVACAPRGQRYTWMLNITVGSQSISPLCWALQSGSLEVAKAMLEDLFVIRADRDRYYYGCDALFERHPDIVKILCTDAFSLINTVLDNLIWRSRLAFNGRRRVNYYVKHLVQTADGEFATNVQWLVEADSPTMICHPVVIFVTDLIWRRLAVNVFLRSKLWATLTLFVFVLSQSILKNNEHDAEHAKDAQRIVIFVCRLFIYTCSMLFFLFSHIRSTFSDVFAGRILHVYRIPFPAYISEWHEMVTFSLLLCLLAMFIQEPILWCFGKKHDLGVFTEDCLEAQPQKDVYHVFSMLAMMLYWSLMSDCSIISTRISSYMLVSIRVLSELGHFILAVLFLVLAFASAASSLMETTSSFSNWGQSFASLTMLSLSMFGHDLFQDLESYPVLIILIMVFLALVLLFLINLLAGQLVCAYNAVYSDIVGYARLHRGRMIVVTMQSVSRRRWNYFLNSMGFDTCLDFNEGDVGLPGGIQVLEPASLNPTTTDTIKRYGGTTSLKAPWPLDKSESGEDENKFKKLENKIKKLAKNKGSVGGSSINSTSSFSAMNDSGSESSG